MVEGHQDHPIELDLSVLGGGFFPQQGLPSHPPTLTSCYPSQAVALNFQCSASVTQGDGVPTKLFLRYFGKCDFKTHW